MSTIFLSDLRALEFPDSDNFHVNPDPLAACSPHSFLGFRCGGQDTAGHFRTEDKAGSPVGRSHYRAVPEVRQQGSLAVVVVTPAWQGDFGFGCRL